MSKYKQASLKRKMRTVARSLKAQSTGKHGDHWVEPSKQKNSSGQRRHRREKSERFAKVYGAGKRILKRIRKQANKGVQHVSD